MSNVYRALRLLAASTTLMIGTLVHAQGATAPVAGLEPDRRPVSAPVIQGQTVDVALKTRRLAGVSAPWPPGLARIAEQGAWYSPMFQPGMPGRYDLRQLHGARP